MTKKDMYNMTISHIDNSIDCIPNSQDIDMANNFYQEIMGAAHLACLLDIISREEKHAMYDRALNAYVTYKLKGVVD